MQKINYTLWLLTPIATRIKIANQFGIIRKGPTEVFNNEIKSDGFLIHDIENALTSTAMQEYLKTDMDDITVLYQWLVQKINEPAPDPVLSNEVFDIIPTEDPKVVVVVPKPIKKVESKKEIKKATKKVTKKKK